ncbi:MAG: hypothetical protein ABI443_02435 [Chthoniobacterales bacterium]
MQPTRIKEKKLGRERAHGLHRAGSRDIEIDPRLKEFQRLMITLHEWMHRHDLASVDTHSRMEDGDMAAARAIEEADVDIHSKDLAHMLWHAGYRRVHL